LAAIALIERITTHLDGTRRVFLRLDSSSLLDFTAGQYLQVLTTEGAGIPFSMASSPVRLPAIELHFRPMPGSPEAASMLRLLGGTHLQIEGPFGEVAIAGPTARPLVLIVAGTGAAQAFSIVEFLYGVNQHLPVSLFWHVGDANGLYCHDDFARFAARPWLHYQPLLGCGIVASQGAPGASTWLEAEHAAIGGADVILCGSPEFVYGQVDAIAARALRPSSIQSDVFAYAPRPTR
jgi:CDP-4-dehydro-6-deoxyglucose reductase, E3